VHAALLEHCTNLPHIAVQQSRMGLPDTLALRVVDKFAHGAPEAFIDDHEFCHVHALPEGGIHLALPDQVRHQAIRLGWVESHPAAGLSILPETLVLVYAPRDAQEMNIALGFVKISLAFAEGRLAELRNLV
jgi:phospholipase/carboxylesterase